MSATLTSPQRTARRHQPASPAPLRLTCEEFYTLGESGVLGTKQLMLIDGEIWEKEMINPPHAVACDLAGEALRTVFGPGWRVRVADPLELTFDTDPEPDLAVVPGEARDYLKQHPVTASLVLEVSDSSFVVDTTLKMRKYAEAGIADYWVLDLNARRLIVHRAPVGSSYSSKQELAETDSIAPLARPTGTIKVADLLP